MTELDAVTSRRSEAVDPACDEELLAALRAVAQAGGILTPVADPVAEHGYAFAELQAHEKSFVRLVELDCLRQRFHDRVSLCPKCGSHHLNLREVCPGCRSANLVDEVALHHFRCGYVGREEEFDERDDGVRICPKCGGRLRHIGVEFDRLGATLRCKECDLSFQDPPVEAVCLSCGDRVLAQDLPKVDVFAYAMTSRGLAALERSSKGEVEGPLALGVTGFRELLQFEAKKAEFFKRPFHAVVVDAAGASARALSGTEAAALIERLRRRLREIDVIGAVSASRYVVVLPEADRPRAQETFHALQTELGPNPPFALFLVEIDAAKDLTRLTQAPA